jgi:protein-S-isoprenylcysteine O-methyltransferase Ste14
MATVLIVNYAGLYVLVLCAVPAGYVMLFLEERELVRRFGTAYENYQREVPQLIPRWRSRTKKRSDESAAR